MQGWIFSKTGCRLSEKEGREEGPWQPENGLPDNPDFVIIGG